MSKIGVFDSGIGGLSVLKELIKTFPKNHFIYLSDEGYFPYGTKVRDEIIERGERIVSFLKEKKVNLVVVACNTMSSVGLPYLKEKFSIPIIGVIEGAVEKAISTTKNGKIGVISTPLTAKSHIYKKRITSIFPEALVLEIGSQELVNIVEDGMIEKNPVFSLAKKILSPLNDVDTLILGCTHFPPLEEIIKKIIPHVKIVDPGKEITFKLKHLIECNSNLKLEFYTTGDKNSFKRKANIFIDGFNFEVKEIDI